MWKIKIIPPKIYCIVAALCGQYPENETILQTNYHEFSAGLSEHSQPEKQKHMDKKLTRRTTSLVIDPFLWEKMLTSNLVRSSFSWPYIAHKSKSLGKSSNFFSCKKTTRRISEQSVLEEKIKTKIIYHPNSKRKQSNLGNNTITMK